MAINGYRSLEVQKMQSGSKQKKPRVSDMDVERKMNKNETQDFGCERYAKKPRHSDTR